MKAFRILTAVCSLGVIIIFSGCGGKSSAAESTQDKQLGLLSHTWKIATVTKDGVDQSTAWTGFQLTLTGTKGQTSFAYTCAGRPALSPWPASGAWAFDTADPVTKIIRDQGVTGLELPLTYTVTATTLQVTFSYTGSGYTRVSSVSGSWVFNFTN